MTNQEIYDLMDRFQNSCLHSLRISTKGTTVEMTRESPVTAAPQAVAAAPIQQVQAAPAASGSTAPAAAPSSPVIEAPLVGTYYAAPAPDQPPFVKEGDTVKEGQTICLIEAMKMISEVPAPFDCVITGILKQDGELVAFHEPIFQYRKV